MSKSTATVDPGHSQSELRCFFIYGNSKSQSQESRVVPHKHPFWQIEVVLQGRINAYAGQKAFPLKAGDSLAIPPDLIHTFSYPDKGAFYTSIKFNVKGIDALESAQRVPLNSQTNILRGAMINLLSESKQPSPATVKAISYLLNAIMELMLNPSDNPMAGIEDNLIRKIKEYAFDRHGRPVTLTLLSRELGLSPSHISNHFRKKEGMPLKKFLDQERARIAAGHLAYADMSIKNIAEAMNFPDPYTFSHFCKRMLGRGPKEIRGAEANK